MKTALFARNCCRRSFFSACCNFFSSCSARISSSNLLSFVCSSI
ncbi:unnamed protein product, partial [Brugia timori]|uniref:Secreted protein n=1 Tax=Brugia timori TaxID=42155 RepID=A0A0R3QKA2_9BILA